MTEHTEEGRSAQQEHKGYFGQEEHKPQEKDKRQTKVTKWKVETQIRNKCFLFVPFCNIGPKHTSTNLLNTNQHTGSSALPFIKA